MWVIPRKTRGPAAATRSGGNSGSSVQMIWVILVLTNLQVFRISYQQSQLEFLQQPSDLGISPKEGSLPLQEYALAPNTGKAVALPSIRIENTDVAIDVDRKDYGGLGDKKHLGGFTEIDVHGISPATWKQMITFFGIKTLMDVGCGRGISTSWFYLHGVDALCVEGSHDAVSKTMLPYPEKQIVEHDFSRGPWWPEKTYDAVWCVEFLEHVGRNYQKNYFAAFRKSALIFATHSQYGGWHHVEVHNHNWWIRKFEMHGFIYSEEWTMHVRSTALKEKGIENNGEITPGRPLTPNGKPYNPQHVYATMLVFINPAVTALPQHAHLLTGPGCYEGAQAGAILNRECNGDNESTLPPDFYPLVLTEQQDNDWNELVKKNIEIEQ